MNIWQKLVFRAEINNVEFTDKEEFDFCVWALEWLENETDTDINEYDLTEAISDYYESMENTRLEFGTDKLKEHFGKFMGNYFQLPQEIREIIGNGGIFGQ